MEIWSMTFKVTSLLHPPPLLSSKVVLWMCIFFSLSLHCSGKHCKNWFLRNVSYRILPPPHPNIALKIDPESSSCTSRAAGTGVGLPVEQTGCFSISSLHNCSYSSYVWFGICIGWKVMFANAEVGILDVFILLLQLEIRHFQNAESLFTVMNSGHWSLFFLVAFEITVSIFLFWIPRSCLAQV